MSNKTRTRRGTKRRRQTVQSPLAHIPWRLIQNNLAPVETLKAAEVERLHEATMQILEESGIAFLDSEALDLWEKAGAKVDHKKQHVWLDRHLVLDLVAKAPSSFTWRARNPEKNVTVGANHITFSPHGGTVFVQDIDQGRRTGMMADYDNFLKLAQMCNVIHYTGMDLVVPHDVPVSFRHLRRSYAAFTLTDKAILETPHDRIISTDAVNMAKIVFGPDIADSKQPVLGGIVNSSSPRRYDERMIGGMITFAQANQVLIITPFILAGAMSPISMAAAVAQQNAEALAGIAFAQVVRPGAPVIYGGFATNVDMKTGSPAFGTPEGAWATMVGAQLARYYNVPYRGSGTLNTAKVPDAQAAYETMWSMWPAVMAHTNFINHATGWLEGGLTVSYEKIIIDMENLAMFQHFLQGVEISDETLALDMIAEVEPGGHHFGTAHTQARYSTEFYPQPLSDRQNYETWVQNGVKDVATRANKIWKQLLAEYEAPPIDEAIKEELKAYVERREQELEGVSLYF